MGSCAGTWMIFVPRLGLLILLLPMASLRDAAEVQTARGAWVKRRLRVARVLRRRMSKT